MHYYVFSESSNSGINKYSVKSKSHQMDLLPAKIKDFCTKM